MKLTTSGVLRIRGYRRHVPTLAKLSDRREGDSEVKLSFARRRPLFPANSTPLDRLTYGCDIVETATIAGPSLEDEIPTYSQQRFTLRIDQSSQPIKWKPIRSLMETGKWATGRNQLRWPDGVYCFSSAESKSVGQLGSVPDLVLGGG